jgi:hypothetical protein
MNELNVNLVLAADFESFGDASLLEKNYQNVFKPMVSFLYSHPGLLLSLSFTGPQISFYIRKHPECIEVLHELISRRQIEILGGGYYAPLFPLLFPSDRNSQIEKMTSVLRSSLGKRPLGACLYASAWENSLVTTFQSCGFEFVLLDSSLVRSEKNNGFPLISSEYGKSLKILLTEKKLKPSADEEFFSWTERVSKFYRKSDSPKTATVLFSFDEASVLLNSNFGGEFFSSEEKCALNFSLPSAFLKKTSAFTICCVHGGLEKNASRWAEKQFEKSSSAESFTVYDYLNSYPQNKKLSDRMMYLAMLISQCKGGDKVRKNAASEKLHESQWGGNFISPCGLPSVADRRQQSYRALNEAEKIARESMKIFKESMTVFDYDGDGSDECVCQMEKYNAVVSMRGGCISDFNVLKGCGSYGASLSRIKKFDGAEDSYIRGIFVEHLLAEGELEKNEPDFSGGIFSADGAKLFSQKKIDVRRKEIQLESDGIFSSATQISLRKKITFLSNGIAVQYILKNESETDLKADFVSEMNFSQTRFDGDFADGAQFSSEIIVDGNREEVQSDFLQKKSGVSFVQVKDSADKKIFVIEPNEESGLSVSLVSFCRPVRDEVKKVSSTYCVRLFWKIDLAPGMEMEKTVNVGIASLKKN